MVEIFDEYGFNYVSVCRPQVRQSSVKITENFAVFFHHFLVELWEILWIKVFYGQGYYMIKLYM